MNMKKILLLLTTSNFIINCLTKNKTEGTKRGSTRKSEEVTAG